MSIYNDDVIGEEYKKEGWECEPSPMDMMIHVEDTLKDLLKVCAGRPILDDVETDIKEALRYVGYVKESL